MMMVKDLIVVANDELPVMMVEALVAAVQGCRRLVVMEDLSPHNKDELLVMMEDSIVAVKE